MVKFAKPYLIGRLTFVRYYAGSSSDNNSNENQVSSDNDFESESVSASDGDDAYETDSDRSYWD
jgi:hypothetical protein